jgi:hypothetical protein
VGNVKETARSRCVDLCPRSLDGPRCSHLPAAFVLVPHLNVIRFASCLVPWHSCGYCGKRLLSNPSRHTSALQDRLLVLFQQFTWPTSLIFSYQRLYLKTENTYLQYHVLSHQSHKTLDRDGKHHHFFTITTDLDNPSPISSIGPLPKCQSSSINGEKANCLLYEAPQSSSVFGRLASHCGSRTKGVVGSPFGPVTRLDRASCLGVAEVVGVIPLMSMVV